MRRPLPEGPAERAGPASGPREIAADDLYAEHWKYVRALLPSYGIAEQDVKDVAQTVWMHVHRRCDSYDARKHKTRRAWITGFVQRCAANHRRTERRHEVVLVQDPTELGPAPGLSAEQTAILHNLHELIPNDDQRLALLLQVRHGLSIEEIAAVQGVSESAVIGRLHMARKALRSDDEEKSRAYLGFGSMEALAEALKPGPIPEEVGEREWQEIAERIRREEGLPHEPEPPPSPDFLAPAQPAPPSPLPPSPALPALASTTGPALVALTKMKLAALLVFAFMSGAGTGVGALLAWLAHDAARHARVVPTMDPATPASAAPSSPVSPTASSAGVVLSAAPSTSTRSAASSAAPVSRGASSTASSTASRVSEVESQRLLAQMRQAMRGREPSEVLRLAEQHAQQFGAANAPQREALRVAALREMGRGKDADEHARAVVRAYPQHRRKIERAVGHGLP